MGAEKKTACHQLSCSFQLANAPSPSRSSRRSGRARKIKERRASARTLLDAPSANVLVHELFRPEEVGCIESAPAIETPVVMSEGALADESVEVDSVEAAQSNEHSSLVIHDNAELADEEVSDAPVRAFSSPATLSEAPVIADTLPAPPQHILRRGRTWPCEKRVCFDAEVSICPITPYSEIYGLHPRFFDFDKRFSMVPAQGFGAARFSPSEAAMIARQIRTGINISEVEDEEEEETMSEEGFSDSEFDEVHEYITGSSPEHMESQEDQCVVAN
jgi:hypothetical protein